MGIGWHRSMRGILVIYGRIFGLSWNVIYALLSEGKQNKITIPVSWGTKLWECLGVIDAIIEKLITLRTYRLVKWWPRRASLKTHLPGSPGNET